MYSHIDMLLFQVTCSDPKCGKPFHEVIRDLAGRDAIRCFHCGAAVDLKGHKRAIDSFMELATELDKLPRR